MSIEDKISAIGMIWDSIDEKTAATIPLTKEQKKELDRRLDQFERGERKSYSWEEVKSFLNMK